MERGGMGSATKLTGWWKRSSPYVHAIFRMFVSVGFMQAGSVKLLAFPIGIPPHGLSAPFLSQAWIGGFLEVFGGLLILVGFCTRPVAFVLSGEMAVAYFQFHYPRGFWPSVNGGLAALVYCFVWLYFSAAGSGPWSVDAMLENRRRGRMN